MKPHPFLLLHVYLNNFIFTLFSGIQLWGSLYALLKAMKGSFTALSGLLTSLVVLHLPQVSMMVNEFSQQKSLNGIALVQCFVQQVVLCLIHKNGRGKDKCIAAAGLLSSLTTSKLFSWWLFRLGSAVF